VCCKILFPVWRPASSSVHRGSCHLNMSETHAHLHLLCPVARYSPISFVGCCSRLFHFDSLFIMCARLFLVCLLSQDTYTHNPTLTSLQDRCTHTQKQTDIDTCTEHTYMSPSPVSYTHTQLKSSCKWYGAVAPRELCHRVDSAVVRSRHTHTDS